MLLDELSEFEELSEESESEVFESELSESSESETSESELSEADELKKDLQKFFSRLFSLLKHICTPMMEIHKRRQANFDLFLTPPPPFVTHLCPKPYALLSQNTLTLSPSLGDVIY